MAHARCSQAASDVGQVTAVAVVVDDEHAVAARVERGAGRGALIGVSAVPSCWSVEVATTALTVPSWLPVVAKRWPVGSNAMLATGPAADGYGPRDLCPAGWVP